MKFWQPDTQALQRRLAKDDGFAMLMAIGVAVFGALVISVVVFSSIKTSTRTQDRKGNVYGRALAENAVNTYLSALRGVANPAGGGNLQLARENVRWDRDFKIRRPPASLAEDFPKLATGDTSTSTAIQTSTLVSTPGNQQVRDKTNAPTITTLATGTSLQTPFWTMQVQASPAGPIMGYWQIARIEPPQYNYAASPGVPAGTAQPLAVYFRAWGTGLRQTSGVAPAATPTVGERAVIVRAEFRPSYFSDYQYVTDDVIILSSGTTINGHVHTNGFMVSGQLVTPPTPETRVWSTGGSCVAGSNAFITSARGDIGAIPGCTTGGPARDIESDNGHYLNITQAAEDAFTQIRADNANGTRVV